MQGLNGQKTNDVNNARQAEMQAIFSIIEDKVSRTDLNYLLTSYPSLDEVHRIVNSSQNEALILKKELDLMNNSIAQLSKDISINDHQFVRKDEHSVLLARLDQMVSS